MRIEAELPSEQKPGEIDHQFVSVTPENKVDKLVELLQEERGLALVFVRTKRGADRLAQRLERHQVRAVAMHGDKTQAAREKALAHFEAGKVTTLIATDVAARGLDLSDITHVINFDPPEDEKAYTHRVGRTGRAGRSGTGVTLVLPDQQAEVSRVARMNGQSDAWEETGMKSPPRSCSTRAASAAPSGAPPGPAGRSRSDVTPGTAAIRSLIAAVPGVASD